MKAMFRILFFPLTFFVQWIIMSISWQSGLGIGGLGAIIAWQRLVFGKKHK